MVRVSVRVGVRVGLRGQSKISRALAVFSPLPPYCSSSLG